MNAQVMIRMMTRCESLKKKPEELDPLVESLEEVEVVLRKSAKKMT